ncbi:hypothetical protein Droror1_Dr00001883 [Drosera rotundifolia]
MILLPILLKMGNYKLEIQGVAMQAHVADDVGVVKSHIADHLIPLHDKFPMPVGFDVKAKSDAGVSRNGILVLCIGTHSLVVQFATQFPHSLIDTLKKIFDKEETCFLGVKVGSQARCITMFLGSYF